MKEISTKLGKVQQELVCPKNQTNSYGHYKYRSCEEILEAVKPLLGKYDLILTLSDEIVMIGDRFYVKATAKISDGTDLLKVDAYARETFDKYNKDGKPMMDQAQITGASSSYARKYALNGLFCIDDTKDADTMDNTQEKPFKKPVEKVVNMAKKTLHIVDNEEADLRIAIEEKANDKGLTNAGLEANCQKWFKTSFNNLNKIQLTTLYDGLKK
jgi:hypothetical protein